MLFDVDLTLLCTSRGGIGAMELAGRELFGSGFTADGVTFAGSIDPLIVRTLLDRNGVAPTPDLIERFKARYADLLRDRLSDASLCRTLPGVMELLDVLRSEAHVVLGILSGNFARTGRLKLAACGIDPGMFRLQVWGDDSPHEPPARDHLPIIAMERYREVFGRPIEPDCVTIVGDTVHDVRCARVNGCRCLGVATGPDSVETLLEAGAAWAVADLSGTALVAGWLTDHAPSGEVRA